MKYSWVAALINSTSVPSVAEYILLSNKTKKEVYLQLATPCPRPGSETHDTFPKKKGILLP